MSLVQLEASEEKKSYFVIVFRSYKKKWMSTFVHFKSKLSNIHTTVNPPTWIEMLYNR
jgi:hypothetical protein